MAEPLRIEPISGQRYEALVPMIAAYQGFYEAEQIHEERMLINDLAEVARERGSPILEWSTAPDNATAQRLYDSTGARHSTWIEYELRV